MIVIRCNLLFTHNFIKLLASILTIQKKIRFSTMLAVKRIINYRTLVKMLFVTIQSIRILHSVKKTNLRLNNEM